MSQKSQSQINHNYKGNSTSQGFNDVVKSLGALLDKIFKDFAPLITTFIFILLISFFILFRTININYVYSLVVTGVFIFLSICLYIKDKSSLNAIFSFSLGIFTAFTVSWNGPTFSIFFIGFTILSISFFIIACIRAAASKEDKFTTAANSYISNFETNKKDLEEVNMHIEKLEGLLPIEKRHEAILFFAYQKVPKEQMISLITALNYLYTITKLDTDLLLILLNNIYYLSETEDKLTNNLLKIKSDILKTRGTPRTLVTILNDTLYIAIENSVDFASFTDTILTYLSRGYAKTSITEQLSKKFTKKTT